MEIPCINKVIYLSKDWLFVSREGGTGSHFEKAKNIFKPPPQIHPSFLEILSYPPTDFIF